MKSELFTQAPKARLAESAATALVTQSLHCETLYTEENLKWRHAQCARFESSYPASRSCGVWNARARNRKSTMLPSWGWSQSSLVVGMGPMFRRSMFVAS